MSSSARSGAEPVGLEANVPKLVSTIPAQAGRILKTLVGLGLLAILVRFCLRRFALPISMSAMVSATVTTVRAPIDGVLAAPDLTLGRLIEPGARLLELDNPWIDDSFTRDLETRLLAVEAEIEAASPKGAELGQFAEGLKRGSGAYQSRRTAQLQAILAESEAKLQAERVIVKEAEERAARAVALNAEGIAPAEKLAEAERDAELSRQRALAATKSVEAIQTQLESAKLGINVDAGGMGSERPYSHQRLDEVSLELLRWRRDVDSREKLRAVLQQQLESARAKLNELSKATIVAPRRSRVWRLFAGNGSFVPKGAPIASLVDCDRIVVVAGVTERVFNRLKIGTKARFKIATTGEVHQGTVVQLVGLARYTTTEDALALPAVKESTQDEEYRVIVSIPGFEKLPGDACETGQSGEVTFD